MRYLYAMRRDVGTQKLQGGKMKVMKVWCTHDRMVPTDELKPNPKNRNVHPQDQIDRLAEILHFQGWRYPIKVSRQSGFVTSGHGRLAAAIANGWKEVPVNFQHYESPEQEFADLTSDNAIALWAELDLKGIKTDFDSFKLTLAPELLGLKDFALDTTSGSGDGSGDGSEAPEAPKVARSQRGEVWSLGKHALYIGDSTTETPQDLPVHDMVFTDPPYGVSYVGKTKDAMEIQNDKLDEPALFEFLCKAFKAWRLKEGGVFYVCAPPGRLELIFRQAIGLDLRECIVWVKQQFVMGRQDYHWRHESILYGWKPGAAHYFVDDRTQDTVWEIDRPRKNLEHPTMKPLELVEKAVNNSSRPGERVFDGFGGSGSTLIACEKTGRICTTFEIDPIYADVILERWAILTGKDPERLDGVTWSKLKNAVH